MEDEHNDANIEESSSLSLDEDTDSSSVDLAEPTADQGGQESTSEKEDVPFNEHPRWQEIQAEKERARQEALDWQERYTELSSKIVQPQQSVAQQEVDPYAGMDPQSKLFLQERDKRVEQLIESKMSAKEAELQSVIQNQQLAIAKLQEKQFRQENVDVPVGSAEERQVAALISRGVPPDQAAWAVMGPTRVKQAELKGNKKVSATKEVKAKANLQTTSLPPSSGVPQKEKVDFRDDLDRAMKEAGL